MADEHLRRLERAAAAGDYEAAERFERARARTEIKPLSPSEALDLALQNWSFSVSEAVDALRGFASTITSTFREFNANFEALEHLWPAVPTRIVPPPLFKLRRSNIICKIRDPPA